MEKEKEKFRIIQGDTLETLKKIPADFIDCIITDPPFSSGTRREGGKSIRKSMLRETADEDWFDTDSLTTAGFVYFMRECAIQWKRILKPNSHILCFIDWRMYPHLYPAIESADLRISNMIVWDKTYFGMGRFFRNQHELILHFTKGKGVVYNRATANVFNVKPVRNGLHPTEKPVELIQKILPVVSKEGDIILDCFCGSSPVGEACIQSGRRFVGIDNHPGHIKTSIERLNKITHAPVEI